MKELFIAINLLHKKLIIHGDLSPNNILINGDNVYIIDFGRSSRVDNLNNKVFIVGTNGYCISDNKKYDDIYNFLSCKWNANCDKYSLLKIFQYMLEYYKHDETKLYLIINDYLVKCYDEEIVQLEELMDQIMSS